MSRRKSIRTLAKDTFWYGAGMIVRKSVGLIMLPIYTAALTTSDYGMLELANVTMYLVSMVISFQLQAGMTWIYAYGAKDDRDKMEDAVSTTLTGTLLLGLVVMVPLLALRRFLSPIIFTQGVDAEVYGLVVTGGFLNSIFAIYTNCLRNESRPGMFNVVTMINFVVTLGLQILFVVVYRLGYYGSMLGAWLAGLSVIAVSFPWFVRVIRRRFRWDTFKFIAAYSAPMVPAAIALWLLNLSNRFFLKEFSTLDQLGLFSVAFRINFVLYLVLDASRLAWTPTQFKFATDPDNQTLYPRVTTYFVMFFFVTGLTFSVLAKDLLHFFVPLQYQDAYKVVPVIALANIFNMCTMFSSIGFTLHKKQHLSTFWYVLATVVCQALNYLFIAVWKMGNMGAALAPTISFGIVLAGIHVHSQKYYRFRLETRRLVLVAAISVVLFLLSLVDFSRAYWINTAYRVGLLASFVPLLMLLRVFTVGEVNAIRSRWTALRRAARPAPPPSVDDSSASS